MWEKIKKILIGIGLFFAGIFTVFVFSKNKNNKQFEKDRDYEKLKLQNTDVDDIISNAPDKESIDSGIEQQKSDFRRAVRDRLNQKLYWKRSF